MVNSGSARCSEGVGRALFERETGARPVKQPLRLFAEDRRKVIGDVIAWLLAAGFIMEVLYPDWLSNPVLVEKKKDDPNVAVVWRMCINYTNLNKACPKDPFPLPQIDQLIDSTAGVSCCHLWMPILDSIRYY